MIYLISGLWMIALALSYLVCLFFGLATLGAFISDESPTISQIAFVLLLDVFSLVFSICLTAWVINSHFIQLTPR